MIDKARSKMQSRTWLLTVYWSLLVSVALIMQGFVKYELPLNALVALATAVNVAYLGKRAVQVNRQSSNGGS